MKKLAQGIVFESEKIDLTTLPPTPWWKRCWWRLQEAWWSVLDFFGH